MPTSVQLQPLPNDPDARLQARLRTIEMRLGTLERGQNTIPIIAGTPTGSTDGHMSGDTAATKLWLKLSGTWRYVTLT